MRGGADVRPAELCARRPKPGRAGSGQVPSRAEAPAARNHADSPRHTTAEPGALPRRCHRLRGPRPALSVASVGPPRYFRPDPCVDRWAGPPHPSWHLPRRVEGAALDEHGIRDTHAIFRVLRTRRNRVPRRAAHRRITRMRAPRAIGRSRVLPASPCRRCCPRGLTCRCWLIPAHAAG